MYMMVEAWSCCTGDGKVGMVRRFDGVCKAATSVWVPHTHPVIVIRRGGDAQTVSVWMWYHVCTVRACERGEASCAGLHTTVSVLVSALL